jgi:hypothetical protein
LEAPEDTLLKCPNTPPFAFLVAFQLQFLPIDLGKLPILKTSAVNFYLLLMLQYQKAD